MLIISLILFQIEGKLEDQLNDLAIKGYRDNPDFQDLVDAIQNEVCTQTNNFLTLF